MLAAQALETDLPLEIKDKKGGSFKIMVRIETRNAGLQALFYCENLLICRTPQKLAF